MDDAPPHRRHRLLVDVEADDIETLRDVLGNITDELDVEGWPDAFERTSGALDAGWHAQLTTDRGMTPERYKAALLAWRDARRAARRT